MIQWKEAIGTVVVQDFGAYLLWQILDKKNQLLAKGKLSNKVPDCVFFYVVYKKAKDLGYPAPGNFFMNKDGECLGCGAALPGINYRIVREWFDEVDTTIGVSVDEHRKPVNP